MARASASLGIVCPLPKKNFFANFVDSVTLVFCVVCFVLLLLLLRMFFVQTSRILFCSLVFLTRQCFVLSSTAVEWQLNACSPFAQHLCWLSYPVSCNLLQVKRKLLQSTTKNSNSYIAWCLLLNGEQKKKNKKANIYIRFLHMFASK